MLTEAVGWISSIILILTIGKQVYKQWAAGTSEGVSTWLFIGQLAASAGFTIYSILVRNWVFTVTNGIMVVNALAGYWITRKYRERTESRGGPHCARPSR